MSEDNEIQIMKYTNKVIFVFRPMQPSGTVTSVEWFMEYYFNWNIGDEGDIQGDMGKIKYLIWDNNASDWATVDTLGHHFHRNSADDGTEYVGQLTTQMFHTKIETNPSYYIDDDGLVKTAISFEEAEANEFTDEYTLFNCSLVTAYNGIILSD